jgi:Uma2 family endonuclease
MQTAEILKISVDDYLEGELISDIKHEYINGDVYAMCGSKRPHNTVSANLLGLLYAHLRNTPCQVFGSDMKVQVQTATDECFFYPDLHVTCEQNPTSEHFNTQPKLIIEVLSDSTERYNRTEKFYYYRQLPSLEEYVLVAQDTQRVECYRRSELWEFNLYRQGQNFYLAAIDLELPVAFVYEKTALQNQPQPDK